MLAHARRPAFSLETTRESHREEPDRKETDGVAATAQDTGGFFVCTLRRVAPHTGGPPARPVGLDRPSRKQRKKQTAAESRFSAVPAGERAVAAAAAFYGFGAQLPAEALLRPTSGGGGGGTLHLLSRAGRALVASRGLRVMSAGAVVLEPAGRRGQPSPTDIKGVGAAAAEVQCGYTLPQTALPLVSRWLPAGGRAIRLCAADMAALLEGRLEGKGAGPGNCCVDTDGLRTRGAADRIAGWSTGGCVVVLEGGTVEQPARPLCAPLSVGCPGQNEKSRIVTARPPLPAARA